MFKPEKVNLDIKDLKYEYINGKLQERKSFDANGHDYVEIAGIKWATMNVGAKSITDTGLYFQWGDTQGYTAEQVGNGEGKKFFNEDYSDYKWRDTSSNSFTKYNSIDKKPVLDLEDDAVHAAWGGSWRMPTKEDIQTVCDAAITSSAITANWTSGYNGTSVAGYEIHDKTSNDTLFLPACGYANDGSVNHVGRIGCYWLSLFGTGDVSSAYELSFANDGANVDGNYRSLGQCVRGVLDVK